MKYKNTKTGERLILGIHDCNKRAEELEADPDWVRVSGTDIEEVREMQAQEAAYRREQLERERREKQPQVVPVVIQPVPAGAGDESESEPEDSDADLHDDRAGEDASGSE